MSSIGKFAYSIADRYFYEPLERYPVDNSYYSHVRSVLSSNWQIVRNNIWFHCLPDGYSMPAQGWKIHISAAIDAVRPILESAVRVLSEAEVAFKFAAGPTFYFLLVSKQWPRGGAGKLITVYPQSEAHFRYLIERLHRATQNYAGPYILSDRRYGDSRCIYYRYGGIAPRTSLTVRGDRTPYIVAPSGEEIPDVRAAYFQLPSWVNDPFRKDGANPTSGNRSLRGGRYRIESALKFSNSGGLYLAIDEETQQKVLIKEARPMVYVDPSGSESRKLLRKEYRLLDKLAYTGIAPQPLDLFDEWEHSFLVEEFIEAITLRQHSVANNATNVANPTAENIESFCRTFRRMFKQLAEALEMLERNKVVFRDLSPNNVLITSDDKVKLVDFEAACELGVDPLAILFTPGFASADHISTELPRPENDYFGLGALMLAYLMPMHAALGLDPMIHERFIKSVGDEAGIPESLLDLIRTLMSHDIAKRPKPREVILSLASPSPIRVPRQNETLASNDDIERVIRGVIAFTLGQATPERTDRLFPCDPKIFVTNPLNLAYGVCGVAYGLHRLQGNCPQWIPDWILKQTITTETYPPGLYVGLAGIAWTLLELGLVEEARNVLAQSAAHPLLWTSPDIFYGLAGWGLTQLKFHRSLREQKYLDAAIDAGQHLLATCVSSDGGAYWGDPGQAFGFAHGASGISVFLLYLFLATGDIRFLNTGKAALKFDLSKAVEIDHGLLWPNRVGSQRVVVPYWRYGSAGVGAALLRYFVAASEPEYGPILQGILTAVARKHTIFPNRLFGLAGLGDFLLDLANFGFSEPRSLAAARRVASGILLFQLDRGNKGIAFPGAELWKISCDYATGGIGIALFLNRLLTPSATDFMLDDLLPQMLTQDVSAHSVMGE